MISSALTAVALVKRGELIAGRLDHLLDVLNQEIGHARRQAVATLPLVSASA